MRRDRDEPDRKEILMAILRSDPTFYPSPQMVMQAPPEMDLERKEFLRDGRRPQGKAKARLSERSGLDPVWWTPESLEAKPPERESICRTPEHATQRSLKLR